MKQIITILFLLSYAFVNAVTINVPADQPTIQAGIDAAVNGDIVLVQPGTYVENINYNGKLITVGSLYLTTQDPTYISSTIIDGNANGSVVTFISGENPSAILSGFTIRNGIGTYADPSASGFIYFYGGGIFCLNNSNPIIQNVTIIDNSADFGGGIFFYYSSPILQNVTITGNIADYGCGIFFHDSSPILQNVTISGNSALWGGGISCYNSSPILQNVTITGNSAFFDGGGIFCYVNSSPILQNVTISGNSAHDGGGIFCYSYSNPSLVNCILWNNSPVEIYFDHEGTPNTIAISYSDIQGGEAGIVTNNNGTVNWLACNIDAYPLFVDPANGDYHLQSISPCIDAGDPNTDISNYETDFDGNPRIRNVIIDMGVYEYQDGGITAQNTIPENDNQAYEFTDTGTTIQFTGTHPATTINATKHNTDPGVFGSLPAGVENISSDRYWNIYSIAGNVGDYDVTFDLSGVSGIQNFNTLHILKRDNSSSVWQDVVTDLGFTLTYNDPSITVNGLTSFSDFGIGGGSDNCLPVVLSSFTAQFINDNLTILWTTQSENNNLGWNVYRGESETALENNTTFCLNNSGLIPGAGTTSEPTNYQFTDEYDVTVGQTYWYWLETVDGGGNTDNYGPVTLTVPEEEPVPVLPQNTFLCNNYPNPFNPDTKIEFSIKEEENGSLTIYNVKGQLLETYQYETGEHELTWDGTEFGSGIYFYKLKTQSYTATKKMIMLK